MAKKLTAADTQMKDQQIQDKRAERGVIRVGPAGWSYADWAGIVYPRKKPAGFHEAAYLAEYFDTIEINTSFYQPVRPEHCELWLGYVAANPHFQFTAKLWQRFAHEVAAGAPARKTNAQFARGSICCVMRASSAPC
jgi:uncharacterized protein YecE (DUF72 family)